jgi:ABC-type uncharacterized transport system auxiliary subunit
VTNVVRRSRAAAVALAMPAVLAACLSQVLPEPVPPPVTYDFGPPPAASPAALPSAFRVEAVTAPTWLRTPSIYYRRLHEQPAALHAYARNRWIAAPSELFAERLAYRLARAAPGEAADEPPLALELELVSFEHVYAAPDEAYVVARARAQYDGPDGRTYEREFETRRPAAAAVDGATAELPRAADGLLDDVLAWLRTATP